MRLLLALPLLAVALPVAAQTTPDVTDVPYVRPLGQPPISTMVVEPVAMMLAACDADGDARVTRDETHACIAKSFAAIDTAKAGSLGYIAYSDWAERYLGDRNALPSPFETDADHDNRITSAELTARLDTIFDRLDRDKDGILTRAECLTIRAGGGDFGRGKRRR
ncbi:MAG TPA: EF-hand domain-containing protein [Sphingomonas sp.]|nr:EF-hand domain-containing protein [Sphingomonas sp.]